MANQYIPYTIKFAQRWTDVGNAGYGNPASNLEDILRANPYIEIDAIIPDGTTLNVPVIMDDSTVISPENLPPWKR